jgi:pyruvate formate lyase activating enzyme
LNQSQSLIFDIKRYSINDGPGIRLTIFFKGCPLSCRWCHNPESISPKAQHLFTQSKCISCGSCVQACPLRACELTDSGVVVDTDRCDLCRKCTQACPTLALEISGQTYSVDELLVIIEKEIPFFDQSGGGVTFSGGEPLMHTPFLLELLNACGERHLHRAVDTSGYGKATDLVAIAKQTDLFLFDLKLMDAARHRELTGVDNRLILDNLKALATTGTQIEIRVPLIAGLNDDRQNLEQMATFIAQLPGPRPKLSFLPFHNVAENKYRKLGQIYDFSEMAVPGTKRLQQAVDICAAHGLIASVGG